MREQYLNQAEAWLLEFVETKPSVKLFARSVKLRARLYYERALQHLKQADSDRKTATEKTELPELSAAGPEYCFELCEKYYAMAFSGDDIGSAGMVPDPFDDNARDPQTSSRTSITQNQNSLMRIKELSHIVLDHDLLRPKSREHRFSIAHLKNSTARTAALR